MQQSNLLLPGVGLQQGPQNQHETTNTDQGGETESVTKDVGTINNADSQGGLGLGNRNPAGAAQQQPQQQCNNGPAFFGNLNMNRQSPRELFTFGNANKNVDDPNLRTSPAFVY